jgi:hypothetical protein
VKSEGVLFQFAGAVTWHGIPILATRRRYESWLDCSYPIRLIRLNADGKTIHHLSCFRNKHSILIVLVGTNILSYKLRELVSPFSISIDNSLIPPKNMNRAKSKRRKDVNIEKKDLERFAGSSDEEEDDRKIDDEEHLAEDEDGGDFANSLIEEKNDEQAASDEEEVLEPEVGESSSAKMANAMARILGTTTHKAGVSSVVLSKTTTPLQRMQMKEKEQAKALREKRRTNRERNLTSLHIPLSVATTNTIETGGQSVAKELEQERFHRRVATRGVVALFNAITQHQKATEVGHKVVTCLTDDSYFHSQRWGCCFTI